MAACIPYPPIMPFTRGHRQKVQQFFDKFSHLCRLKLPLNHSRSRCECKKWFPFIMKYENILEGAEGLGVLHHMFTYDKLEGHKKG